MTGFVLGMGRSGTMWTATALREAAGLDAVHETSPDYFDIDPANLIGKVEVNSFLWNRIKWIEECFEDPRIVHLVRDGRDVVRSVLSRPKPGRTLGSVARHWNERNNFLRGIVFPSQRFRFEDLLADFSTFERLAAIFGGMAERKAWEMVRERKINARENLTAPHWTEWDRDSIDEFDMIAGKEMRAYGYEWGQV